MEVKSVGFGGIRTGVSAGAAVGGVMVAVIGVVVVVAGATDAVGAPWSEPLGRAGGWPEAVAGVTLLASAMLVFIVAMARTRLASQEAEIERLRARAMDAELRSEWQAGEFDPVSGTVPGRT